MSTNKILDKINDAVEDAIRPIIAKGASMTAAELDVLTKAVCTIEKIKQIEGSSGNYDDGNSFDEYLRNSYNSYDDGNSYRRGRSPITGRYVSRDAMPYHDDYHDGGNSNRVYHDGGASNTYHAGTNSRRYYDGGSAHNGYSGHSIKDRMIDRLERMFDEAQNEHERQTVNEWINRLRNN